MQTGDKRQLLTMFYTIVLLVASSVRRNAAAPVQSPPVNSQDAADYAQPFIVGGEPTSRCDWPWMTAITTAHGKFVCGATLISSQWLLTAAHCVYNATVQLNAAIGAYNLTARDEAVNIPIKDIIVHSDYTPSKFGLNDIALLYLSQPVDLSASNCVEAIHLPPPEYNPRFDSNCWILGWGRTGYNVSIGISEVLMQKKAKVISNTLCQWKWQMTVFGNPKIYPENVCIDNVHNVSACQGDSGGPLQCYIENQGWTIVGVSSWGSSACKVFPSVFMRVTSFDSWIVDQTASYSSSDRPVIISDQNVTSEQ